MAPNNVEAQLLKLRNEKNALNPALRSDDPVVFFPAAARQLEIDAILAGLPHANTSDVIQSLHFENEEAETAREIFSRRDELAYGGSRGGRELSSEALRRYQGIFNLGTASK